MQKQVFDNGIDSLIKSFPEKQVDYEVVWAYLQDLTDQQFAKAISEIIQNKEDINKATNIVALIRNKALITNKLSAAEAWQVVLAAIRHIGSWGQPKFDNPLIQKAVSCMGWREICLSETPMADRAHFLKMYEQLSVREKEGVVINPKIGIDIKNLLPNTTAKIGVKA